METNFELYIGLVHAAALGNAPAQRLSAALNVARTSEPRTLRPRIALDRGPAAESPVERPRSATPIRNGSRVR
jgi:hypothetical protein